MKKIIYWLIGLLVYWIIPVPMALAAGEFQADYNVTYSVTPTGSTIVTQQVSLTNKETNFYPKQYSVVIDTDKISDVIARDDAGVISPQVSQADGKTTILLAFNQKIVGFGRKLAFTLRFQNQDIATHNGSIWEINIPGVTPDPDLNSYNVSLEVPSSFGANAYLSPLPADGKRWNKEQMLKGGVSAAYGEKQIFNLSLGYFLENPKVTPVQTEIALPPDTSFQKIEITSLDPKPVTVIRDADGNWLARYVLLPGTQTKVSLKAIAEIYLYPRKDFKEKSADLNLYLASQKFWESDSPKIKNLAKQYITVRAIYNYVVSTLVYDYKRVGENPLRKGALAALDTPSESICMEFTDLFVALARAGGIPAREAVGFAYTTNSKLRPLSLVTDVLHSWPEYYDSERALWIPVDPTWGNTTGGVNYFDKFDFNHIVFAIHGLSSSYPYPAGFYRQNGATSKDVNVTFGNQKINPNTDKLVTRFSFPGKIIAGFKGMGKVEVVNESGLAISSADIVINASPLQYSFTKAETNIPPYAKLEYPLTLSANNLFTKSHGRISVLVNGQTSNFFFTVEPLYWLILAITFFTVSIILLILLLLVKLRAWKTKKSA